MTHARDIIAAEMPDADRPRLAWPAPRPTSALPEACRRAVEDDGRIRVGAAFRIAAAAR